MAGCWSLADRMNFVSFAFLTLFVVVMAGRLLIGRKKTEPGYVALLLGASLVFYAWHIPAFLGILILSSTVDYFAGLLLGGHGDDKPFAASRAARRAVLVVSLGINLGLLALFKYAGFLGENVVGLVGQPGEPIAEFAADILLPMGISFYTFQSMSYTIDVYRGILEPIRNYRPFLLFIVFFPQLVAGPIVRASEFLPQLPRIRRPRAIVLGEGAFLIVSGYFLKTVCADNLAAHVDAHWQAGYAEAANSALLLALSAMFAGQIFCDFAGYSNIARGLAYLLGYRLPVNFNAPFLAASFKNFWERWHITLSRWLRDYLYVPLGGNRGSRLLTYRNLLLVMLLGGLWHGAAWTFVVWGGLHGSALAVERLLGLQRDDRRRSRVLRLGWFVVVQALVLVTWIVFRSESLTSAWRFIDNMLDVRVAPLPASIAAGLLFLVPVVLMHLWTWLVERGVCRPLNVPARAMLAGAMLAAIATAYGSTADFIYFQF
jgi:alginate O-acetyltransferase complex protein AlgI